jgi:hypothetical protein
LNRLPHADGQRSRGTVAHVDVLIDKVLFVLLWPRGQFSHAPPARGGTHIVRHPTFLHPDTSDPRKSTLLKKHPGEAPGWWSGRFRGPASQPSRPCRTRCSTASGKRPWRSSAHSHSLRTPPCRSRERTRADSPSFPRRGTWMPCPPRAVAPPHRAAQPLKPKVITWAQAHQHFIDIYIKYVRVYNKLEDCYDQVGGAAFASRCGSLRFNADARTHRTRARRRLFIRKSGGTSAPPWRSSWRASARSRPSCTSEKSR